MSNPNAPAADSTPFARRFSTAVAGTVTLGFAMATTPVAVAQALAADRLVPVAWHSPDGAKKVPLNGKGWQTKTPEEGLANVEQHPNAGVAFKVGGNLVVVDIDRAGGMELFLKLVSEGALPLGPRVKTGHGWHLYFRATGLVPQSVSARDHGIDTDGQVEFFTAASNRWIALPPSVHPVTKQSYQWQHADLPLPDLPRDVLAWLIHPQSKAPAATVASLDDTAERSNALASILGTLRAKGAGENALRAFAVEQNAQFTKGPLPERELEAVVQSILKYPVGSRLPDQARPALAPLQRQSVATLAKNPALLIPPPVLLSRLVWEGRFSLFAGREKDGKTTYAAWAVIEAVNAGRTVLWISTDEDQATIVGRFVHLVEQGLGLTDPTKRDALLDRISVLNRDPDGWEEIDALHTDGWRPSVYVIDTLATFLMAVDGKVPETSEGEVWHAKMKRVKAWVENTTSGVLALAHANRADGTYRGSTGIGAGPDAIVTYYSGLSDTSCRRIERKGRFGIGSEKTTIRYLGDEHPGFEEVDAVKAGATVKRLFTDKELAALRPLCEAPGPLRTCEWEQEAKDQTNASASVVDRARRAAEKAGFISRTRDRKRWQVTPVGWEFAANQKMWQVGVRYPFEEDAPGEPMA